MNPWISPRGAKTATAFYDITPLRETLLQLVDVGVLNSRTVRIAAGVSGGSDRHGARLGWRPGSQYALAARAGEYGGAPSHADIRVDLFSVRGVLTRDIDDVLARQKGIQYSSRTRLVTDDVRTKHDRDVLTKALLAKTPDDQLSADERQLKSNLAHTPEATIWS
jgi:NTE family protein